MRSEEALSPRGMAAAYTDRMVGTDGQPDVPDAPPV
jgi:hypothetical protein